MTDLATMLASTDWKVTVVSGTRSGWHIPGAEVAEVRSPFDRFPLTAPMSAIAHFIGGIATARTALRYCRRNSRTDQLILHANEEISGAILAYALQDIPLVYTLHNPPPEIGEGPLSTSERILRKIATLIVMRFVSRRAKKLVALSSTIREYMASHWNVPESRIVELPLPVDTGLYRPSPNPAPRSTLQTTLLFVGRLDHRKGVLFLLEMMKRTNPAIVLDIIGDGPLRDTVEDAIESGGLSERVHLFSRLPLLDLVKKYQAADLLVLPSNLEAYPRVVIEAAACGLPIVLPQSSVYRDFIEGGFVQTFAERSESSFANCIEGLHHNIELRHALGMRARAYVEVHNSPEIFAAKLRGLYQETVG